MRRSGLIAGAFVAGWCFASVSAASAADVVAPSRVVAAPAVAVEAGPCLRFNVAEWSWYDYCWWQRHPLAWTPYWRVRGQRVRVE